MSLTNGLSTSRVPDKYLQTLLKGDRAACRELVNETLAVGVSAYEMLNDLVWPTMERMQALYKDDQITLASMNMGTRLNRTVAEQLTAALERKEGNGKKVLLFCGNDEPEELGGQICADLFEADGYKVLFGGGGVPDDEVLKLIGEHRPDLLVMFATLPTNVPGVRRLIDYLREVNSCPEMQILCCGGIYKRAEGLADEIGADLYAPDGAGAVTVANAQPSRKASAEQQTVGRTRRARRTAEVARSAGGPVRIAPKPSRSEAA
ncbi:MAG TPA: B12-binding domain-containing protein [Tepidisphaeraceae bacterium]|jgi:methanogenic corrinoid protein MtbC1|nr:B12-binding domain-containing protein [Tepidisphaeraceae bacterium]